jgi:glycosyltransferase involved in cell wall biosynthesis
VATPVLLVAGKDPFVSVGGHGAYVRAHGRAAVAAGFEPHVFSVMRRAETLHTEFGTLHRQACLLWPERAWMAPGHVAALTRAVERFVRVRGLTDALIHAFGQWGAAAVIAARRLRRHGVRATAVVSAYATYAYEIRATAQGVATGYPWRVRLEHSLLYGWSRHVVDRVERRGYANADALLVNYESVRRLLEASYGLGARCRLMPYTVESAFENGITIGASREPLRLPPETSAPLIVAVSRHDGRKGVDILLRALAGLRAGGIPFRACLVGGGPLLDIHRRLATRLGLDGAVSIPGFVPEPRSYLRAADIFVLPSLRESSGSLSLIEALQAGLPVVASGCDGIPEDVEDGRSGLLVAPGDAGALGAALARLIGDPPLRKSLASGAREAFRRRFTAERVVDAIGRLYTECTPGGYGAALSPDAARRTG